MPAFSLRSRSPDGAASVALPMALYKYVYDYDYDMWFIHSKCSKKCAKSDLKMHENPMVELTALLKTL